MRDYHLVINFWFNEISPSDWWKKDEAFDEEIRRRFLSLHEHAVLCELYAWRDHAEGALAEIIILDQFSRNMFRKTPRSFAHDGLALALAQTAIKAGYDQGLPPAYKMFMYMPFMHSESSRIHEHAVRLFSQPDLKENLGFELQHKEIIDRFGRYPHRNHVLGRESTTEELAFLRERGEMF